MAGTGAWITGGALRPSGAEAAAGFAGASRVVVGLGGGGVGVGVGVGRSSGISIAFSCCATCCVTRPASPVINAQITAACSTATAKTAIQRWCDRSSNGR